MTPPRDRSPLVNVALRLAQLVALAGALVVASASAASADIGDKGSPEPLTVVEKLGYFAGIPILVLLISAAIFMRPGSGGASRYRPNRGWDASQASFGHAPLAPEVTSSSESSADPSDDQGGGSRGSW